jgi:hypothetical protein
MTAVTIVATAQNGTSVVLADGKHARRSGGLGYAANRQVTPSPRMVAARYGAALFECQIGRAVVKSRNRA